MMGRARSSSSARERIASKPEMPGKTSNAPAPASFAKKAASRRESAGTFRLGMYADAWPVSDAASFTAWAMVVTRSRHVAQG